MSSTSSPTLTLDVRSRHTERAVAGCAIVAGASAPLLMAPLLMAWGGLLPMAVPGACLGLILWLGFRRLGWLGARNRLIRLAWRADGSWLLTDSNQRAVEARLRGDARIGRSWVWLRWDATAPTVLRLRTMLLTRADLGAPELRRLIVRLRLEGDGRHSPGPAALLS
jgi:hypothetical protein